MSGKVVHVLSGEHYDLYVGRAMPRYELKESPFGNPYKIGPDGNREEVLREAEAHFRRCIEAGDGYMLYRGPDREPISFVEALPKLSRLTLACWCAPKDGTPLTTDDEEVCHGQVLLRLAEELA